MDALAFVAACAALLATPGPTNSLLATSGASHGVRRSLPLLAAELCGYALAICLLRLVLGPLAAMSPTFAAALGIAAALYLFRVAWVLWRRGAAGTAAGAVTFDRIFFATVMNPKAIIFAFALLPVDAALSDLSPRLLMLGVLISTIGAGWIAAGAALVRRLDEKNRPAACCKAGAVALAIMASLIGAHALGLA